MLKRLLKLGMVANLSYILLAGTAGRVGAGSAASAGVRRRVSWDAPVDFAWPWGDHACDSSRFAHLEVQLLRFVFYYFYNIPAFHGFKIPMVLAKLGFLWKIMGLNRNYSFLLKNS